MTTSITIGQIIPNALHQEDREEPAFIVLDNFDPGPVFEGDLFYGYAYNRRNLGGMQWRAFLEESGLKGFFATRGINEEGFANPIDWDFVQGMNYLFNKYVQEHSLPPGYGPGRDGTLARFIWFKYWVEHAVRSYSTPGMFIG